MEDDGNVHFRQEVRVAGRYLCKMLETITRTGTSGQMGTRKGADEAEITGLAGHGLYATLTKQVAGNMRIRDTNHIRNGP